MIPILILAAGQSTRMQGIDKVMIPISGVPLLRRQIDCATGIGPVFVALPGVDHPRMSALHGTTATPLYVRHAAKGIGHTLREAVGELPPCDAFMIALCDLVSLTNNDLQDLVHAMGSHPNHVVWRGATCDGKPGHPVIFSATLRPAFANLTGDQGASDIIHAHKANTYLHRFIDDRARHDLDTPQDWAAWIKKSGQ